jgi:PAS domain S-box-containing protein
LGKVGRGERADHFETVRLRQDGTSVEVSVSVSPVKSPAGATVGACQGGRDIGRRKSTELALTREIEGAAAFSRPRRI